MTKLSEKIENKAIDVGGKVVEEGAKNLLGIGGAFGLLLKLGAVGGFLLVLGFIALVAFLVIRFL
jgi:hypothetical protein